MSPEVSLPRVEMIDSVQLLVILFISSFQKKIFAVIQVSSFIIIALCIYIYKYLIHMLYLQI